MIQATDDQRYAARANNILAQANNFALNLKRLIEEGVAIGGDGQPIDTGMKGWGGFKDDQKEALQSLISDFAESNIVKPE